jgi:DNA ligase-1
MSKMQALAQTAEAISKTPRKTEKVKLLADYFAGVPVETAAESAIYLSGKTFPAYSETTLNVGGSLLWRAVGELSHASSEEMSAAYRQYGDLGSASYDLLKERAPQESHLSVEAFTAKLVEMAAARGPVAKSAVLIDLLSRATPLQAKYIIKIITGDLRIGLKESLVEEAIGKAYSATESEVRRANMLLGDISEALRLAAERRLAEARMRMYHPIAMMLATPVETAEDAFACFDDAQVEDKYDGIRAQVHCGGMEASGKPNRVRIFSRTYDDVTGSFPELVPYFEQFPNPVILDGEILAWQRTSELADESPHGRALPFSALQTRLGRKKVTSELIRSAPVAYLAFDILFAEEELIIDKPLRQRREVLEELLSKMDFSAVRFSDVEEQQQTQFRFDSDGSAADHESRSQVLLAPAQRASSPEEIDRIFNQARVRGNEGLMIKDLNSAYLPGRRGQWWMKMKRELATLDVVVTAAEYGHGKRAPWLSDYTFAVRGDNGKLLNVGKAYSGVTDEEIKKLTEWFLAHTMVDEGWRKLVEPSVVLEVAFNNVMISDRHDSGYALRFPRIVRIREDKMPQDIDTVERVRTIYEEELVRMQNTKLTATEEKLTTKDTKRQ